MSSLFLLVRLARRDRPRARAGRDRRARRGRAEHVGDARLGPRGRVRRAWASSSSSTRSLTLALVLLAVVGARGGAVRDPPPAGARDPGPDRGLGGRGGARAPPLARRGRDRRRRALPPRARAQARRARRPLALVGERVRRRRAPSRLRLPALARASSRSSRRSRSPTRPRSCSTSRRSSRRSRCSSPTRRATRCSAASSRPRPRPAPRSRSRRWRPGTAAPTRRSPCLRRRRASSSSRRARARARCDADAVARAARERGARLARPRGRPSRPTRSSSGSRSAASSPSAGPGGRSGCAAALLALGALVVPAGLFLVWLVPVVRSTASVSPDAAERARAFDQYAGQLRRLGRPLLARAAGLRAVGRGRRRGAAPVPLDGARLPAALGGVRRRRLARDLRDHARALAVHAVLGRRLALAGAAARRLPAVRLRVRRGHGRARLAARPASRRRSRSAPGSSCSGSTPATSATRSSRAARPGRRGSRSSGASSRSSLGLRRLALGRA